MVNAPIKFTGVISENVISRSHLVAENRHLRDENLILRSGTQQLNSLQAENKRLRELLDSSIEFRSGVVVADVMAIETSPIAKQLIINKGGRERVYLGQPVVDAYGVVGQIVRVDLFSSTILLITDSNHALPVQIERNGLRTIANGNEYSEQLNLSFVPLNADINLGDRVITSGLGQRFPAGYPVGEVIEISVDPGAPFQRIVVAPTVDANKLSQVLLVSDEPDKKISESTDALEE